MRECGAEQRWRTVRAREQTNVGLGELSADEELAAILEDLLDALKRLEQRLDGLLVPLLSRREAAKQDSISEAAMKSRRSTHDLYTAEGSALARTGATRPLTAVVDGVVDPLIELVCTFKSQQDRTGRRK